MFDNDFFECGDDACDGPGPPPKFHMPPPPRPPFLQDLNAALGTTIECSEDGLFDLDVCAAIPVSLAHRYAKNTLEVHFFPLAFERESFENTNRKFKFDYH